MWVNMHLMGLDLRRTCLVRASRSATGFLISYDLISVLGSFIMNIKMALLLLLYSLGTTEPYRGQR